MGCRAVADRSGRMQCTDDGECGADEIGVFSGNRGDMGDYGGQGDAWAI